MQENSLVSFYPVEEVMDAQLRFAVIAARCRGQWIFCRHRERDTWEIPGGRRELGEDILQTARRELYEETGALDFQLFPVCVYAVQRAEKSYGMLCFARITRLAELPADSEIAEICLRDDLPDLGQMTYPAIQPALFQRVEHYLRENTVDAL